MKKVFFILILMLSVLQLPSSVVGNVFVFSQVVKRYTAPLTIENIISELKRNDIQYIDIVVRQIIWETGHLKSRKCLKDNNLFGFNGKVKKFDKWEDSIKYYKLWQTKRYKGGSYYTFLTKIGYAEDEFYVQNLQKLSTKDLTKFYT